MYRAFAESWSHGYLGLYGFDWISPYFKYQLFTAKYQTTIMANIRLFAKTVAGNQHLTRYYDRNGKK